MAHRARLRIHPDGSLNPPSVRGISSQRERPSPGDDQSYERALDFALNLKGMMDHHEIAAEILAAFDAGRQVSPFSARNSAFDLDDAYHVTAAIRQMREARGEVPAGRKIGFTNRTIWAEYEVYEPIWGYLYNHTVHQLEDLGDKFSLLGLAEPRIEPEIVFKLALTPTPGLDEMALLACIDWVAHGFEIVQSIFPG